MDHPDDILRRLAAIAPTLSNATLRVLIALLGKPSQATSRYLAEALGIRRRTAQHALYQLRYAGLIQCSRETLAGLAILPGYPLTVTGVTLPEVPAQAGTPPAQAGTPPAQAGTPPETATVSEYYTRASAQVSELEFVTRARAGGFPNCLLDKTENTEHTEKLVTAVNPQLSLIDRVLRANARDYRKGDLAEIRRVLQQYFRQYGRNASIDQPGEDIAAQLLRAAQGDVQNVKHLVRELESERKEAGELYAWIITVGLQRFHGISPETVKQRRAALRGSKVQTTAHKGKRP